MKQAELAELISQNRVTITNIENGKNKGNFEILKAICEALDVSADWLLFGEERKQQPKELDLNEEGKKLLKEYKKFLMQNYQKRREYDKVGNL